MRVSSVIIFSLVALLLACGSSATSTPVTNPTTPSQTLASTATDTPASPPGTVTSLSGELTVFAASSLTESFNQLQTAFIQEHPEAQVTFSFAGSQQIRTQLENGAVADIFASADQPNMDGIVAAELNLGAPAHFATNRLTVIAPTEGPGSDRVNTLADLAEPGVKLVLAAPDVPVGHYARESLEKLNGDPALGADFATRALANLVSEESNVRLVAQKVVLGEVDAGIVYQTDAAAPGIAPEVREVTIPEEYNVVASYPIVTLKTSNQPELAEAFVQFVLSAAGQDILSQHGFGPAPMP